MPSQFGGVEVATQPAPVSGSKFGGIPVAEQTFGAALAEYAHKLNPLPLGNAILNETGAIAHHPIDEAVRLAKAYSGGNQKMLDDAKAAADRGDYVEAARHALYFFVNGLPGTGDALEEAGNKMQSGDYAGGLADTAALGTQIVLGEKLPAIVEGAAKVPGAVAAVPSKVAAVVKAPGNLKIAGGAAATVGAVPMFAHEPLAAVYTAGKGLKAITEGIAERGAAARAAELTGGHDIGFLNDIAGEDFLKLSPQKQAGILQIANRLDKPVPTDLATPPAGYQDPNYRTGVAPYHPNAPPSKTLGDILREESAARAGAGVPGQPLPAAPESAALRSPVRPPLAPLPSAVPDETVSHLGTPPLPAEPAPPVVTPAPAPARMSLDEAERDMAATPRAQLEAPGRSLYAASGDVKSPQLRAAEIENAARFAKAARFDQALAGKGYSAAEIEGMAEGEWNDIAKSIGEKKPPSPATIKQIVALAKQRPTTVGDLMRGKDPGAIRSNGRSL